MYEVDEKMIYTRVEKVAHTVVGTTCHNNGGFQVAENIDEIMKMIKELE
jgi:hypothetical protein